MTIKFELLYNLIVNWSKNNYTDLNLKGDYLNIGTGEEIGIYNEVTEVALVTRGIQWFVPEYRIDISCG